MNMWGGSAAISKSGRKLSWFAIAVLLYNIPVILWGAYVRASFSGDGCGSDWPFCGGQVVPHAMARPMAIEFTHRMMTSLDVLLVGTLAFLVFRAFPKKHVARRYAAWSVAFLFVEALLGAGLVIFRKVAHDESIGRGIYLSAHLTNTLMLLAALTATAWLVSHPRRVFALSRVTVPMRWALLVTVLVSITGALAALGDTLFPSASLQSGLARDFTAVAPALLRLRIFHPAVATVGAIWVLWTAAYLLRSGFTGRARDAAVRVMIAVILQFVLGALNLGLLAPLWLQTIHLAMADAVWIAMILLALETTQVTLWSGATTGREAAPIATVA